MNNAGPNIDIVRSRSFEKQDKNVLSNTLHISEDVLEPTGEKSTIGNPKILPIRNYANYIVCNCVSMVKNCSHIFMLTENEGGPFDASSRSFTSIRTRLSFISHQINIQNSPWRRAVEFLHEDKEFLIAAETGNSSILQILIRKGADIQQKDHLGRNALHLAVCADNERAINVLLEAGILPNVKDNLGMTPLSLCLMRRPSLKVANLLFDHGAELLPRSSPMDTGLFLQFCMMCVPTAEEGKIIKLLTTKGALINDPEAPGGRQALHFAAMSDNCTLISILVDLGADLYLVNHRNVTPKEVALTFKCKNAYALLNECEKLNEQRSPPDTEK